MNRKRLENQSVESNSGVIYTTYSPAREILKTYRVKLTKLGIGLFVEAGCMRKTVLSDDNFAKMMRYAMELALDGINRTELSGRYLQIRCMDMQCKLFLKFTYSSDQDQFPNNRYFEELERIISTRGGYLAIDNLKCENVLKIALPVK
ncbi:MAG: hypothetical protein PHG16_00040 [Lachnospiraceae bacterium]|nr:hypothetical protein [Lachnospiraceae bacterium]